MNKMVLHERPWGFVVNIGLAPNSENTQTPFRFDVLTRISYLLPSETEYSCLPARVEAFASNCLCTSGAVIQEGNIITGVLASTYGKHLTAVYNTWETSTMTAWRQEAIGPFLVNSK